MSVVSYESNNTNLTNVILYCAHKDCEVGKIATYYCNKCAQPYCLVCDDIVHTSSDTWQHRRTEVKNISTTDFESAYKRQLIAQINECADNLDAVLEDINVRMTEVQMPLDEVQDNVRNHFAELRKAIDKREKALQDEVKQLVAMKVHVLRRQKTLISIVLTHADRVTGFQDNAIQPNKAIKAVSSKQDADINGLQLLLTGVNQKLVRNLEPCETSDYPVHFDSVNMFGKLNSYGMLAGPPPPGQISCEVLETMAKIRIIWSYKNCLRRYQNTPDFDGNAITYIEPHKVLFLVECAVVKARVVEKTDDDLPDQPPVVGLTRRPSIKTPGTSEVTPRRGISRAMSGFSAFSDFYGDNPDDSMVITSELTFFEVGRISANEAWASLLLSKNNSNDTKLIGTAGNQSLRTSRGSLKTADLTSKSKKDIHSARRRSLKKDQTSHATLLQMESKHFDKMMLQNMNKKDEEDGLNTKKPLENTTLISEEGGGKDMMIGVSLRQSKGNKKSVTIKDESSTTKENIISTKSGKTESGMVVFDENASGQVNKEDDQMFYDYDVNEYIGCSLLFRVKAVIVNDKSEEETSSAEQSSDPKTRCQAYNSIQIIELFPNSKWSVLSKPLQVPSKFVVFREFKFQYPFDPNGLLYWLGTQKQKQPYKNPHSEGYVFVEMSSYGSEASAPFKFVCHSHTMQMGPNFTKSEINAWMGLDLGLHRKLLPTHYCLRHGRADSSFVLRSWVLQGRVSMTSKWVTLRRHDEDSSLPAEAYAVAFWPIMASVKKPEVFDQSQLFRSSKMNSQSTKNPRSMSTKNITRRRQDAMKRPSTSKANSSDEQSGWSKLKRAVSNMGGSATTPSASEAESEPDGKPKRNSLTRVLNPTGRNSTNRSPGRANLGVSIDTASIGLRNRTPPREEAEGRRSLTARDRGFNPEEAAQNEFAYLQQKQHPDQYSQTQSNQPPSQSQTPESSSIFPMFRTRLRAGSATKRGSGTTNSETDAANEGDTDVSRNLPRTASWGERILRRGSGTSTPGQTRRSIDGDSVGLSEDGDDGNDPNSNAIVSSNGPLSRNSYTSEIRSSGTNSLDNTNNNAVRRSFGEVPVTSSESGAKQRKPGIIKRASVFIPKLWSSSNANANANANTAANNAATTEAKSQDKSFFGSIASKLTGKAKSSPKDATNTISNSDKNQAIESEREASNSQKALSEKAVKALTGEDTPGQNVVRSNSNKNSNSNSGKAISNKSPSQSKKLSAKDSIAQRFRSFSFSSADGPVDTVVTSNATATAGEDDGSPDARASPNKSSQNDDNGDLSTSATGGRKNVARRKSFENNLATIPETLTEINSAKSPAVLTPIDGPPNNSPKDDESITASAITPMSGFQTPIEPYSPHSSPRAAAAFAASFDAAFDTSYGTEQIPPNIVSDRVEQVERVMKSDNFAKSASGRSFSLSEPAVASGQVNLPSVEPVSSKLSSSAEYNADSPHSSPRAAEAFAASFGFGDEEGANEDESAVDFTTSPIDSASKFNSPSLDTIPSPVNSTLADDASRSYKLAVSAPVSPAAVRKKNTNIPMASPLLRSVLDFENGPESTATAGDDGEIIHSSRGSFSKMRTRSVDFTVNSPLPNENETEKMASDNKRLMDLKQSEIDYRGSISDASSGGNSGQETPRENESNRSNSDIKASRESVEVVDTNDPNAIDALSLSPRATLQSTQSVRRKSGINMIDSNTIDALSLSPRAGGMQRRTSFKDTSDKDSDPNVSHTQKIMRRKSGASFDPMGLISKVGNAVTGTSTPINSGGAGGAARRKSFHSVSSIGSETSEMVNVSDPSQPPVSSIQQSTQRRRGSIDKLTASGEPTATTTATTVTGSALYLPRRSIVNMEDEDESNGYRYFRIVQHKGILQSSHLSCAGIEFYGKLTEELT